MGVCRKRGAGRFVSGCASGVCLEATWAPKLNTARNLVVKVWLGGGSGEEQGLLASLKLKIQEPSAVRRPWNAILGAPDCWKLSCRWSWRISLLYASLVQKTERHNCMTAAQTPNKSCTSRVYTSALGGFLDACLAALYGYLARREPSRSPTQLLPTYMAQKTT